MIVNGTGGARSRVSSGILLEELAELSKKAAMEDVWAEDTAH